MHGDFHLGPKKSWNNLQFMWWKECRFSFDILIDIRLMNYMVVASIVSNCASIMARAIPTTYHNLFTNIDHNQTYTPQKKFSNISRWNCGSRNCSKIWNAGCAQSTLCSNLTFTPLYTSNVIVFFIKFRWGNIHGNVFSGIVLLKDTLIEIKGKFP